MSRDQKWLEMKELRARDLNRDAWIPLRASKNIESGPVNEAGYTQEVFACGSAAFPIEMKERAEKEIGWSQMGLMHDHEPYVQDGVYYPAHDFVDGDLRGVRLVLSQRGTRTENGIWHLNPDLFLGLRLKHEGDLWLAMDEGYVEVVREKRDAKGDVCLIEIRASHLKDFLAARGMALYVSGYWSRMFVDGSRDRVNWATESVEESANGMKWQGRVDQITRNGMRAGEGIHIMHVGRTNFDPEQDVPEIGPHDEFNTESFTRTVSGDTAYRFWGELWRNQWVLPGERGVRMRGDKAPSSVFFFTDGAGNKESGDSLRDGGRWLWFRPGVINACLGFRNSQLEWYTADTGRIFLGAGSGLHFGVNQLGLVNVYAKDIGFLSEWEQQVWVGYNVPPDGKVSAELLDSQAYGEPAHSQAPEGFLKQGLDLLNSACEQAFGFHALRSHGEFDRILRACHRFRAVDQMGLYALAKDLARITADSLDAARMQAKVTPPKDEHWRSLKTLEKLLGIAISAEEAHEVVGPLFAVYDLRLADAHLPPADLQNALGLLKIDPNLPTISQGKKMLASVVTSIHIIAEAFTKLADGKQK